MASAKIPRGYIVPFSRRASPPNDPHLSPAINLARYNINITSDPLNWFIVNERERESSKKKGQLCSVLHKKKISF